VSPLQEKVAMSKIKPQSICSKNPIPDVDSAVYRLTTLLSVRANLKAVSIDVGARYDLIVR